MLLKTLLILILCAGQACAAWNVVMHGGRRHVPVSDVASFYRLKQTVADGNRFVLSDSRREIRGQAGKREVHINNVKFVLCFPLVARNGTVLISAMDVTKIIEPVMRPGKIKDAAAVRTVILDAGHGGHDSGATSVYGREKDFTLDVVLRSRKLLQAEGYNVRLTRMNDVFVPLEKRAAFASKYPNAIFVSVHFNKSKVVGGTGIETFSLAPRGVPSMDEERVSFSDLRAHPGNARDPENIALATAMHSAMLKQMRLPDRGIKRARFVVLRDITIPGVLLEGGFVNHPLDGRFIASTSFRDRMARAIVDGVTQYRRTVAGSVSTKPSLVVSAADKGGEIPSYRFSAPESAGENTPATKPKVVTGSTN